MPTDTTLSTQPTSQALEQHEKLQAYLQHQLVAAGGKLSFAEFMAIALYTPDLVYYMNASEKFGATGDFVTAPELSALFSQSVALQCAQITEQLPNASILEFGAGSGIMAADILLQLERCARLPEHYYILEISPTLQKRQQQTLQKYCPHLLEKISWLDTLPENKITGIILANEVLDAMPVEQFKVISGKFKQRFVGEEKGDFVFLDGEIVNPALTTALQHLQNEEIEFPENYLSEINLHITSWLSELDNCVQQGVILLFDYGYPRQEYYHVRRHVGTLQCHYQHRAHPDPLQLIGLQDITAHVDFTAVVEAAVALNIDVLGFTSQAIFLLNNDLLKLLDAPKNSELERLQRQQQVEQLTLPSEMGELFKVLALGKQVNFALQGFSVQDRLHQL